MTQQAQAAKMIRKDLKAAFPTVKFSVNSESFAGGDAVNIRYVDGVPSIEIDKLVKKYQYGHFNSMEDIYEHTNNRDDIPQVKYVCVQREISPSVRQATKEKIAEKYGIVNIADELEWNKKTGDWSDDRIWRELQTQVL